MTFNFKMFQPILLASLFRVFALIVYGFSCIILIVASVLHIVYSGYLDIEEGLLLILLLIVCHIFTTTIEVMRALRGVREKRSF